MDRAVIFTYIHFQMPLPRDKNETGHMMLHVIDILLADLRFIEVCAVSICILLPSGLLKAFM